MLRLKVKAPGAGQGQDTAGSPSTGARDTVTGAGAGGGAAGGGGGGEGGGGAGSPTNGNVPPSTSTAPPRLKLKASQPPTPATEQPVPTIAPPSAPPKKPAGGKEAGGGATAGRKRGAKDDISPGAKRVASDGQAAAKRLSLKLKASQIQQGIASPATASAVKSLKIGAPKRQPTLRGVHVRHPPPPHQHGTAYDSEDSEREDDPAIQQGLILRMQPGEDAELLRTAIAENRVGVKEKDGLEVSLRFLTNDLRRALLKIRGRMYAAVLVDLPCIIESMKSWDKKGWWKVADVCQMLLVLGTVKSEAEVRDYPLPREVNKDTMQYAHGITPPMHHVRKRRFRKRVSHKQLENVEEEVERLLREDEEWESMQGKVSHQEYTREEWLRQEESSMLAQEYNDELDAEGEAVETVEGYAETPAEEEEEDDGMLEMELENAFNEENLAVDSNTTPAATAAATGGLVSDFVTDSPVPMPDQTPSFSAVDNSLLATETPLDSTAATPAGESSDDDEESDYDSEEDSPDVVDEDAAQEAAQRAQNLEEVADLEREIAAVRAKANGMANQLLKRRELEKLAKLESDLGVKRMAYGLGADADDGVGGLAD